MKGEARAPFDLLTVRDFFDARARAGIVGEMRASSGGPASVYGRGEAGGVEERVRRVTRVAVSQETNELVKRRLIERRSEVEEHFGVSLGDCEEPQFLRYGVGDFFVAHQDGNTSMLRLDSEQARRVSLIVFLNAQSTAPAPDTYGGGSLVFHAIGVEPYPPAAQPGALLAFRAETTHEVTPVTHGERFTIVSWFTK